MLNESKLSLAQKIFDRKPRRYEKLALGLLLSGRLCQTEKHAKKVGKPGTWGIGTRLHLKDIQETNRA